MVNFSQVISASIEWTAAVLLRPFQPKKWLILGFVALLAGQLTGGGCHSSFSPPSREPVKSDSKVALGATSDKSTVKKSSDTRQAIYDQLNKIRKNTRLLILIIAFFIFLWLLFIWLYARFAFIFLDDVARNQALIKAPFKEYRKPGNSLFKFYLVFGAFSLSIFIGIIIMLALRLKGLGLFNKVASLQLSAIIFASLPYICVGLLFLLALGLVYLVIRDFVQIVMFKDGLGFTAAWQKTLNILGRNKGDFVLYILIKIAVAICAWIASAIAYFIISVGLIFQGTFIALAAIFLYKFLPAGLHIPYVTGLIVLGVPALIFLLYCLFCIYLPFAVFLRAFSLKFMASIAPGYNLFEKLSTAEA